MKKILMFIILLLPFYVYAEDSCSQDDIQIESIVLDSTQGNIEQTTEPNTDNNQINLGLKANVIDDNAVYKVVIKNTSNQDYTFDQSSLSTDYLNYDITYEDDSDIVKAGESKTIYLKVHYATKPATENLTNGTVTTQPKVTFNLQKEEEVKTIIEEVVNAITNPNTNDKVLIYLGVLVISLIVTIVLFRKYKKAKLTTMLIITFLITTQIVKAVCTCQLNINTELEIDAKEAIFINGRDLNMKMKQLAGDDTSSINIGTKNYSIKEILQSNDEPINTNKEEKNIVSTDDSPYPIYMWFDNGIIYWWSEDKTPSLNEDSSYLFVHFFEIENIEGIENFDASNVTEMNYTFFRSPITNLDSLSKWNTENLINMAYIFSDAKNLNDVKGIKNWNVKKVEVLNAAFRSCFSLEEIDLSNWETQSVREMVSTFGMWNSDGSPSTEGILKRIILSDKFDTSKVTNLQGLLANDDEIEDYSFLQYINAPNNTITYTLFQNNLNLKSSDLEYIKDWDMSKVTDSEYMFFNTNQLETIEALENWDISSITEMNNMFSRNSSLKSIKGIENWNTTNVTKMNALFTNCISLESIDLSKWDTSNVTDMSYMFSGLTNLEVIDISSFDTSKVTDFSRMFNNSNSLKHIYVGEGWDTSANTGEETLVFPSPSNLPNYDSTDSTRQNISHAHTGEGGYLELKTNN